MYKLTSSEVAEKVESLTFAELNMQESDIEELLRKNIDMICDEEESMLIVGRQVRNEQQGRSDLTAVDNDGDIVLIEIKRDLKDIESRREAFEFQAIRYAASYATIKDVEDLVNKVYAPYIEKYRNEFENEAESLTSTELGMRKIIDFLEKNHVLNEFNEKQKVVLVASDFDEQTLSAVAWLNNNGVNMSCFKLIPYQLHDEIYIKIDKVLPVTTPDDYYVDIIHSTLHAPPSTRKRSPRRNLPRIHTMLEWGVIQPGDTIVAKDRTDNATLLSNGNVLVDDNEMSLQSWLKKIYGWSSVQTYAFSVHEKTGKTLSELRAEYMKKELGS